jgi:hypothetical protein
VLFGFHVCEITSGCAGLFQAKFLLPLMGVPAEKLVNKEKSSAKLIKAYVTLQDILMYSQPCIVSSGTFRLTSNHNPHYVDRRL